MGDGIYWIKIRTDMFSDEKINLIEALPDGDTILIIWVKLLCLAGSLNRRGELFLTKNLPFSEKNLAKIFKKTTKKIQNSLKILEKFGLISKGVNGAFLINNWEKHQNIDGMERIREQAAKRQADFRQKKKGKSNVTDNVTSNDEITLRNATETEIEKEVYRKESIPYKISKLLYDLIKERNPKHRKANLQKWAKNVDLLIRKDKRTPEEIEKVIIWSQQDDFWKNNILSTENLRKSFDKLYLKMNGSKSVTDSLPQLTNEEEAWQ